MFNKINFCCKSDKEVTQLKFLLREDADSLVVAANGAGGSLIEVWELLEKPLPVHKLFQPKTQPSEPFKTVVCTLLNYCY